MVLCLCILGTCVLLFFVCLVSLVADPSSTSFKEWLDSVLADTVGGILFRYLGCAFIVAGMLVSVSAYAAEEGPGQDPAPEVTESVEPTATPKASLGDDHAPDDPVITMPPSLVTTSEPFATDPPQELPPVPEVTPDNTPGLETPGAEGNLKEENSTPSNTPVASAPSGGGIVDGPEIFDDPVETPVPSVEPTPMLVDEYQQELLQDIQYIEGLLCFIVVVILCYFSYKFFRIFF